MTRSALTLRALGATFPDIAAELGVPTSGAMRRVHDGMRALGVSTQAELIAAVGAPATTTSEVNLSGLTIAEAEVARCVVEGASNASIATT